MDSRTINSSTTSFTYAGDLMDTASGGESFDLDFDDNGNMTTGVSQTITYNWDNKLRTATKGTKSISLRYDPGGNRIWKQSIDGAEEITRKYIVDIVGDLPTTLMEIDPNIDVIVKTYIYANGQVLSRHDGDYSAPRYFYIHDRLGSVRQIIDSSGNVKNHYIYEPFGELLDSETQETISNPFKFTGQYFDSEINQYYLRARQYDPHIYRFTSRDPILGQYKEPLTLHRYLYCGNNPINYTDINGEWAVIVGGSFSGNITLGGAASLTKSFGIFGYYLGLFSQLSQTLECFGAGGTAGAGIFLGKNTEETGWFNFKGLFWGGIRWAAGGGSIATSSGASLTADFALSPNAMKAEHLGGWFTEYGGSVTFPAPVGSPFWFATASFTYSESDTGIDLYTLSGGTAYSTWGVGGEGHIYRGYAWVTEW